MENRAARPMTEAETHPMRTTVRIPLRTLLLALLGALIGLALLPGAGAHASQLLGTVQLDAPAYTVSEHAGNLKVTIVRTNPSGDEWVGYGVRRNNAVPGVDFDPIPNTRVHLAPGQTSYSFNVHVYDQHMNTSSVVHAAIYMYGAWPQPLGPVHSAGITILRDDPLDPRDNANPLGLPATPYGNVLFDAPFYIAGPKSDAGIAAAHTGDPTSKRELQFLAAAPNSRRFWYWNEPNPTNLVANYLEWTQRVQPGSVVQLSTYSLVHGGICGLTANNAFAAKYQAWINDLADAIGNFRVVMYFEVDSVITAGCLSSSQRYVRFHDELAWAINRLERDPHLVLYLDGGAADAAPWRTTAAWLAQAGVHQAQGFFLNSTHFDWTTTELSYGQRIAQALGGVHFVVDTQGGGRGPLKTANPVKDGNEVLCNPPGRGLGPLSTSTGYKWADAFSWFDEPGMSGGTCRPGAPPIPYFWAAYAEMLVANRVTSVTGPSYPLVRQGTFVDGR
jgi:endoglucanase